MKKLSITLIFSLGLIGSLLTACFCKDVQPYWKPTSGSISLEAVQNNGYSTIYESDTIEADSVGFILTFEAQILSQNMNPLVQFGNMAYAMQKCPVDGHEGLKYNVIDCTITCNEDFNGIPAGNDIKSYFTYEGESLTTSFSKVFDNYEHEYVEVGYDRMIFLVEEPSNNIERNFSVKWDFSNGESVVMESINFTW